MLSKLLGFFRGGSVLIQGASRLPDGQSKCVALGDPMAGGKEIVLCRVGGVLYALDRVCPHEGGRIHDGPLVQGKYAVCPLHNYKFDPSNGRAVGVTCADAKVYRVREENGAARIWV